jgi:hypothetical protein
MKTLDHLTNLAARLEKYEQILFGALLLFMLWPIWTNKYFLTLDGPCHLYNSKVLLDFWRGEHVAFFSGFYDLNHEIDPNWFSHIVLANLMRIFSPQLSEKILLTSYIIGFLLFSRWLIIAIDPKNRFLIFIPFLFVYNHVFQMGFYNFSFSLMWMILTLLLYIRYREIWSWYLFTPVIALSLLLTYITHPLGYLIAIVSLALILTFSAISISHSFRELLKYTFRSLGVFIASALPSLLLLIYFVIRRPSHSIESSQETLDSLGNKIIHLSAIINLTSPEDPFAKTAFFFMASVTALGIIIKLWTRKLNYYDGFFIVVFLLVLAYFFSPGSIGGIATVYERMELLPFIVLPFWFASISFPRWLSSFIGLFSMALVIGLMAARIPVHIACSEAVSEYMSVSPYVRDESTVLPLSYAHNGKKADGQMIADRTWIFFHAGDYIGTLKPTVMMGNYEGNTGYFPLLWRGDQNPFAHSSVGDGIEGTPPKIDLDKYEKESNKQVDYIVLLCLDDQYKTHPNTIDLMNQLQNKHYTKVFTSEHGRAILYSKN